MPMQQFRKSSSVRYRNLLGEGVVVQQAVGEVLVINTTGLRVLALIDAGLDLDAVATQLAAEFTVDAATAAHDVAVYVQDLHAAGIIEPVS